MLHSLQQPAATAQQGWGQAAQAPCMASGEKRDKAQASAHLTAWQEDRQKCGVGAGSPGILPTNPSSTAGERTASQTFPCALSCKSAVCREKLGRWGRNPAPLMAKKKRAFLFPRQLCEAFLQGLDPPQLHKLAHPGTRAATWCRA